MKGAGRANPHKACSVLPMGAVTSGFWCLRVPPLLPPCAEHSTSQHVSTAFPWKVFRGRKRTKATLKGCVKCWVISGEARSREGAVQGRICSHPHPHLHPHHTLLSIAHALGARHCGWVSHLLTYSQLGTPQSARTDGKWCKVAQYL